jgi:type VI secretion system protein ImpC
MRTQLSWVMAGSRFAHYVKVIVRETNGSLSPRECGVLLNRWLAKYVAENGEYRPLKQAGIEVSQDRAGTGICTAMLWLEPQFPWLDDESVVLHLAVPLPLTFEQG